MGLYRRADSPLWWYSFTVQGRRFRGSTQTPSRADAEIILAKLRHDALIGLVSQKRPDMTLDAATGRYYDTHAADQTSADVTYWHLDEIAKALGKPTLLADLTDDAVARAVAKWRGKGLSGSSCNRRLTILRAVLRMARDRWGAAVAMPNWKAHWLREPAPRDRYLTPAEAERLIEKAAAHLKAPIRFSLLTGVRLSNCIGLDWSQVDMQGREIRFRIKSKMPGGKPHVVPMSLPCLMLLQALCPKAKGRVFLYRGRPIASFSTSWRKALKKAEVTNFRWHDLRSTAASWMVQNGVPLDVVQDVLGHESIETTRRYAYRETTAKRAALDAIGKVIEPDAPPAREVGK